MSNTLTAICFIYVGYDYDRLIDNDTTIWVLTSVCGIAVLLTATTDMVIDGWAVTMLKPHNFGWQISCNYIGATWGISGFMIASLALTDGEFMDTWVRSPLGLDAQASGLFTIPSAFYGLAIFTILITMTKI